MAELFGEELTDEVDILELYDHFPITEARATMREITEKTAHSRQRVVLTKHGRPVAVVVPVCDLATLHAHDAQVRDQLDAMDVADDDDDTSIPLPSLADEAAERVSLDAQVASHQLSGAEHRRERNLKKLRESAKLKTKVAGKLMATSIDFASTDFATSPQSQMQWSQVMHLGATDEDNDPRVIEAKILLHQARLDLLVRRQSELKHHKTTVFDASMYGLVVDES